MAEQYRGQFKSNDGVLYTAIISNDNYTGESEDIPHFESEGEIEISWSEVEKYDVIQGSEAKVRIISETDRRFIDMYTETPGSIRLDVYKNDTPDDVEGIGSLYWSGCLDCEFYEEPYSEEKNYAVELTFSDFGILDRLKFDMTDLLPVTLQSIMERALTKSCIAETAFDESMIALDKTLSQICIYASNFYDEDNVASSWKEVVEQILQPLSIKMIQRNGVIYLYDLHSLYNSTDTDVIEWRGNNATLGVDKVYNNCKVTFSPYSACEILSDELGVSVDTTDIGKGCTYREGDVETFYDGYYNKWSDGEFIPTDTDKDFSIFFNPTFNNLPDVVCGQKLSMRSIYGGEDNDVIATVLPIYEEDIEKNSFAKLYRCRYMPICTIPDEVYSERNSYVFRTPRKFIPIYGSNNCCIIIQMQILFSFRVNWFRDYNYNTNFDNMQYCRDNDIDGAKYDYQKINSILARIRLYDEEGNVLYTYEEDNYNEGLKARGTWVKGDTQTCCDLDFYNPSGSSTDDIFDGWIDLRHHAHNYIGQVSNDIKAAPSGEYLPMPPEPGYIEIEIVNTPFGTSLYNSSTGEYYTLNYFWFLMKKPSITLHYDYMPYDEVNVDDIETNGVINESAKENLELDFNCGTPSSNIPFSRGVYFDVNNNQYHKMTRAGRTDTAEQLFIGTCFSQYAKRNTTLQGDVKIDTGALKSYTDPYIGKRYTNGVGKDTGEDAKKFMMVEDVQQLSTDRSETKFVEFMKDIYTKK